MMHAFMLVAGGGIVGLGLLAFDHGAATVPMAVYEPPPAAVAPETMGETVLTLDPGVTVEALAAVIADRCDREVIVRWPELQEAGIVRDLELGLVLADVSLPVVLDLSADVLSRRFAPVAWRVDERRVELGLCETFDRRERVLVTYDLRAVFEHLATDWDLDHDDAAERVSELLHEFVEPEAWEANGGDLAHLRIVGGKMFVQAPPRMHARVQWILAELGGEADGEDPGPHGR
ncbi:MAG: hypothetical protein ACYTG1_05615 [Planctomycetota bacterium]|jgi:hypothetical protein